MAFTTFFDKLTNVLDSKDYSEFAGRLEELRCLLKTSDTPEVVDTPAKELPTESIHELAKMGNIDGIKMLLDSGVSVDQRDLYGYTPLTYASKYSTYTSTIETVKFLIDSGADVNARDKDTWTPLMYASSYSCNGSSIETVKLLIDSGADVNTKEHYEWTPLTYASKYSSSTSSIETVKLLIDSGANVNICTPDMYKSTPLMYMARFGTPDVVKALLDAGAQIDTIEGITGRTALFYAAEYSNSTGDIGNLTALIDAGADLKVKDAEGKIAVQVCVEAIGKTSSVEAVKMLIDAMC